MKKIVTLIFVSCIVLFSCCYGQSPEKNKFKMDKEVKAIVKLGRDSIIQLALTQIDKEASLENFTETSIQTNGKEIYVVFSNRIVYLPLNSAFYGGAYINLITKSISQNVIANPVDFTTEKGIPYYKETEVVKKHIDFVIKAITANSKSGIVINDGVTHIREKADYYEVTFGSEMYESWCRVKKISGEVYNEGHAELIESYLKNEDEMFEEIQFKDH